MNTTLFFTDRMHSFKFTVVLLSSSIIPILIVYFFKPRTFSTFSNIKSVKATSSGPCIFGLTIYTDPVREFPLFLKSCIAAAVVINASIIPSGISEPSFNKIDGLVIKCPTLRFNINALPCNLILFPFEEIYSLSEFSFLINFFPFFFILACKSPFIRPSQF